MKACQWLKISVSSRKIWNIGIESLARNRHQRKRGNEAYMAENTKRKRRRETVSYMIIMKYGQCGKMKEA